MTPQARRRLVPLIVILAAASVMFVIIFGPRRQNLASTEQAETTSNVIDEQSKLALGDEQAQIPVAPKGASGEIETSIPSSETSNPAVETSSPSSDVTPDVASDANVFPEEPLQELGKLALQPFDDEATTITLGALDDIDSWQMEAQFTRAGAGIASIRFSNIFETIDGKLNWRRYRNEKGDRPSTDELYLLTTSQDLKYVTTEGSAVATASVLGASQVIINGQTLHLVSPKFWHVVSQVDKKTVTYEAIIVDDSGNNIAKLTRAWTLSDQFELRVQQSVQNLSSAAINVQWLQYGPPSLTVDRSRYMDRRRFRFGWELSEEFDPLHAAPIQSNDILWEHAKAAKHITTQLWPTDETVEEEYKLSWFASTNRYFALAVYSSLDDNLSVARVFTDKVQSISSQVYGEKGDKQFLLTALWSPQTTVASGDTFDFSMGVYAGPLKRSILDKDEPYISLHMRDLVLYQMSSMCAFCTFQWLADFLAMVLATLDQFVVFDWGFAIILLVLIVRSILHPITKKSQINMQRFGKVMQKLKPEIEKLKKKYPNDPKKVQSEQMVLMQKYGVNPLQMLGCLPMFLQMPIWIALYALLYFMFDIRQEPAFFGIFQLIGDWPFLADLSASDHFFGAFSEPKHFLLWNITGINILPILMGGIFYIQQKYMSPSMATTPDQESQQKIMRVMMVVMFPLMLYSAPSGLTLYILTSSTVGILESRHIRKHIDNMDIQPKAAAQPSKRKKPKDKQGRAWADAMEARRKKVQNKAKKRNFKKKN